MPYPTIYDLDYSYTGFASGLGDGSFPGTQIDNDLAGLLASIQSVDAFIEGVFRSDGVLKVPALPQADDLTEYTQISQQAANTAAEQAGIATQQAGIATTQAGIAQGHAGDASGFADTAAQQAGFAQGYAEAADDTANAVAELLGDASFGQCRLNYVDGSTIRLDRHDGAYLTIGGAVRTIPASGPTLAPTGLTPGATYYVYAYWTGTEIALEASATVPDTHTNGMMIETGDASRTLVGMVNPDTGPVWADTQSDRRVLSWFNRRARSVFSNFSTNRTTTSTDLVELNTENRVRFLSWGDDNEVFAISGNMSHSATGQVYSALGLDSEATVLGVSAVVENGPAALHWAADGVTAGFHTMLYLGSAATAGTATFSARCQISGQVWG